jgi:hypothetical protein
MTEEVRLYAGKSACFRAWEQPLAASTASHATRDLPLRKMPEEAILG